MCLWDDEAQGAQKSPNWKNACKMLFLFHSCKSTFFLFLFSFLFVFLRLLLQHMEVPRLGVKLELQLPAYTSPVAMPDLSPICNLHHSSQQHRSFHPLSEARDGACLLTDTSQFITTELPHNLLKGEKKLKSWPYLLLLLECSTK